jgi:DNA-binding CsgD family transcriptional regulator
VERLSARERERIAELVAEGAPFWRLLQEVPRSRYAIYRAVKRLKRPPAREPIRSPLRLSMAEREEISRGLAAGESLRVIADRLARAPSTVSREVARNGGRPIYRAGRADRAAVRNMRRPKVAKLARCPRLREAVEHGWAVPSRDDRASVADPAATAVTAVTANGENEDHHRSHDRRDSNPEDGSTKNTLHDRLPSLESACQPVGSPFTPDC